MIFDRNSIRGDLITAHNRRITVRVIKHNEARFGIGSYIHYYADLETAGIEVKDDNPETPVLSI